MMRSYEDACSCHVHISNEVGWDEADFGLVKFRGDVGAGLYFFFDLVSF